MGTCQGRWHGTTVPWHWGMMWTRYSWRTCFWSHCCTGYGRGSNVVAQLQNHSPRSTVVPQSGDSADSACECFLMWSLWCLMICLFDNLTSKDTGPVDDYRPSIHFCRDRCCVCKLLLNFKCICEHGYHAFCRWYWWILTLADTLGWPWSNIEHMVWPNISPAGEPVVL